MRELILALFIGCLACLTIIALTEQVVGQPAIDDPMTMPVNAQMKNLIIDSALIAIDSIYVFPDVARKMAKHIRDQNKKKAYDTLKTLMAFTAQLTDDLREVCHDRHLGIRPASIDQLETADERDSTDDTSDELQRRYVERARADNFGFYRVERMPGNIGYLDLRGFVDATFAGETAVAAMKFLGNTDALIVDLRKNSGGDPSMIQLISSYFVDEPTHLNSFYIRELDTMRQFWTQAYVDGRRMSTQPIYVLTSDFTFSGAEEFSYNLKNLKRATIVGDTTGGGAHPVQGVLFASLKVSLRVPFGRAVNPITNTNWEGTGVIPDVACSADSALDVANMMALDTLSKLVDNPDRHYEIEWILTGLKAQHDTISLTTEQMAAYVGDYGPRHIYVENGQLTYRRDERDPFPLIPMGDDLFEVRGLDFFRIKFERNDAGKVTRLVGLYQQGRTDFNDRTD